MSGALEGFDCLYRTALSQGVRVVVQRIRDGDSASASDAELF
jgi:hypothetical protein